MEVKTYEKIIQKNRCYFNFSNTDYVNGSSNAYISSNNNRCTDEGYFTVRNNASGYCNIFYLSGCKSYLQRCRRNLHL